MTGPPDVRHNASQTYNASKDCLHVLQTRIWQAFRVTPEYLYPALYHSGNDPSKFKDEFGLILKFILFFLAATFYHRRCIYS